MRFVKLLKLGLRLVFKGGREALMRVFLTSVAVAVGATLLLGILAEFHAFQTQTNRPTWENTSGTPLSDTSVESPNAELWNYSQDTFKGQTIERLDVAALSPHAPLIPGLLKLPGAGQYYVSPVLASLLRSAPADELSDRFPGSQVGLIGNKALSGPNELVIVIGYTPAQLKAATNTVVVSQIATGPNIQSSTAFLRFAFGVGAVGILLPIVVLVATATRLNAGRREERYAAMRLVGATPRQINVIASVDSFVGSALGVLLAIVVFTFLQPWLANKALFGTQFFPYTVTPTIWGYILTALGVPVMAIAGSMLSLRRVQITPLGVSRKVVPPSPKVRSIVPLLLGIPLFIVPVLLSSSKNPTTAAAYPGLVLIIVGLMIAGPWLTMQSTHVLSRFIRGASSLIATRRLASNPKASFRSIGGLILAVFVGTIVSGITPVALATQKTTKTDALTNVLASGFVATGNPNCSTNCTDDPVGAIQNYGLPPQTGSQLLQQLRSYSGVTVFPIYSLPTQDLRRGDNPPNGVISCENLAQLQALGQCAPGLQAVEIFSDNLVNDYNTSSVANQNSGRAPNNYKDFYLRAVLVKVNNASTLETIRTFLAHTTLSASSIAPKTFGEVRESSLHSSVNVERVVLVAIALILFIAACSLAVNVGGSIMERKQPFTLLRLTGISVSVLRRVVLIEALAPLVFALIVAAGTGYGLAVLVVKILAPSGTSLPHLGTFYFLTMGIGIFVSIGVIVGTLPLVERITRPENARFE